MRGLLAVGLCLVFGGCGCDLASFFSGSVAPVLIADSGADSNICSRPWAEVYGTPELNSPWSGGPIGENGFIRQYFDGGVRVREVLFSLDSGVWTQRDIFPLMQVAVLGRDGTLCGTAFDDAGYPRLRLEFPDGGVVEPATSGNCLAYDNGWWVSWVGGHVLRGRGAAIESLANVDAGIIPGLIEPGVVPSVGPISERGDVLIFINYRQPSGWVLPGRQQLNDPVGFGAAAPLGFAGGRVYGFNFGPAPRRPFVWDEAHNPHEMSLGDGSVPFVRMTALRGHSDGHFCGSMELVGASSDSVAFWKRDGGLVAPGVFRRLGIDIEPVNCWPVGPNWFYVVHFPDGGSTPETALLRLELDCLPD